MAAVRSPVAPERWPVTTNNSAGSESNRFGAQEVKAPDKMNRAAVSIPEKLFFKIGEVCDITGIQAHVLRYWESEFPMLAPQKNRAGQRTYRKRDVEMVLRIKELLYEDQYTIAGAKKKLSTDLRGASKLKVVTPEMSAQVTGAALAPQPFAPQHDEEEAAPSSSTEPPPAYEEPHAAAAAAPPAPLTDERRDALRRLSAQMRELLTLLDADQPPADTRRR